MTARPWTAHLKSSSPRYRHLVEIFGDGELPLKAARTVKASAPGKSGGFYQIDVSQLTPAQVDRITAELARRFGLRSEAVRADLFSEHGLPIPEEDVSVVFSMRSFL